MNCSIAAEQSSQLQVSQDEEEVNHEEDEQDEEASTFVASGECQIVGIRYYNGVAHPGEFVILVREPHNPYDRNAIRVDNMHGDKVGHIKATSAKHLAPIMDNATRLHVRIEGTIPRKGGAYGLPLSIEYYSTAPTPELTEKVAKTLQKSLRYESNFSLSRELGGNGGPAAQSPAAQTSTLNVVSKKLDWNKQQQALDEMFDKHLEEQYNDLPNINMPSCLRNIELFDYQIQGIKWLLKKETGENTAPFYKSVKEGGKNMYLCEITQSSQSQPPSPIKGSILCDVSYACRLLVFGVVCSCIFPAYVYVVH